MAAYGIGMISGGLDSTLSLHLLRDQGVRIKAINFYTGFCITETQRRLGGRHKDGKIPRNEALRAGADLGVEVELVDISESGYLDIVANPRYGYGANANPCIDCRVFMMSRAREIMEREGADFVFTGEVLGQRPKSQRRDSLALIEKQSGLTGRLLRPLSAKLLPPTIPELEGKIDREKLLGISGRGRKPQIELAARLGVTDFPQPAGGCCFLTDESFGRKFHDLLDHREVRKIDKEEIVLLATGRHFRLAEQVKLVVGRTDGENHVLERYADERRWRLETPDHMGPLALVEGEPDYEQRLLASRIVARYGQGRAEAEVRVAWRRGEDEDQLVVPPFEGDQAFESLRV
ncbi:MAG: thiamine biosynthesis protein [Deltaproteobacteria bacterium]